MADKQYILVTGGAGYIGSHTVVELVNNGYNVVIVDNLCNLSYDSVARIEYLVGQHVPFVKCDLRDRERLLQVFRDYLILGVIHFAALKAVGESVKMPLAYYENNINGTVNLLEVMLDFDCTIIVFLSLATVYGDVTRFGDNRYIPIPEDCPMDPTNPYGRTKFMMECILKDIYQLKPEKWRVAILRYFNPIGAHPLGIIGEDPLGIPNNLLPFLAQVAIGRQEKLRVFGNDYNSHDGTPIRDYIHVVDLAKGHIAALKYLHSHDSLYREWNLGSGKGLTVFDVFHAFCKAVGRELPYEIQGRRAGDVLDLTANPTRANKELEWQTHLSVDEVCVDLWRWTTQNPFGFNSKGYSYEKWGDSRLHTVEVGDLKLKVANYGALIQDLVYQGQLRVLHFDSEAGYKLELNPFIGTTVGPYANRISGAKFEVNGTQAEVEANEAGNCLHSGTHGWDKQQWFGPAVYEKDGNYTLKFRLVTATQGFPGTADAYVSYSVSNKEVTIEYEATSDADTAMNITNHTYFSKGKTIDDANVTIHAQQKLQLQDGLPTGELVDAGVGSLLPLGSTKLDDCFVVNLNSTVDTRNGELVPVVQIDDLTVLTTEPAFQVYLGDGINTEGHGSRSGLAVEPSRFVNAINVDQWKQQVVVAKGETYGAKIAYRF